MSAKGVGDSLQRPARRHVRRSAQQWRALFDAYSASGLSAEAFCGEHGLAKSSFRRWHRRLHISVQEETPAAMPAAFLSIPLTAPDAASIEVRVDDMTLRLEGGAALRVVDAIVARIGSRS